MAITRPTGGCPAVRHETEDVRGATIRLHCTGVINHVGSHLTASGLYWSEVDPTPEWARLQQDQTRTELSDTDRPLRTWHALVVDGLSIPGSMVMAKDLSVDTVTGFVTLTLRARESVHVNYTAPEAPEPVPDSLPQFHNPNDPSNPFVVIDLGRKSDRVLANYPHVHGPSGMCVKNRAGAWCEAPRPGVAE